MRQFFWRFLILVDLGGPFCVLFFCIGFVFPRYPSAVPFVFDSYYCVSMEFQTRLLGGQGFHKAALWRNDKHPVCKHHLSAQSRVVMCKTSSSPGILGKT